VQRQHRQERSLLRAGDVDVVPVVVDHLEPTE
jgi:hypothetical protein